MFDIIFFSFRVFNCDHNETFEEKNLIEKRRVFCSQREEKNF